MRSIVDPSITLEYEHLAPDRTATLSLDVRYAADPEIRRGPGTATTVYESTDHRCRTANGSVTHDVPATTITDEPAIDVVGLPHVRAFGSPTQPTLNSPCRVIGPESSTASTR
ncbi:MAG: hypothetical protein U5K37_11520 [Natrialbaceae archaeon]|nr:hypothetical protein [Natrialbaceae archaeon]